MASADESAVRPRPSRRRLLAASGVGLATALGGCTELRTDTLAEPEPVDDDDRVLLRYHDDGDRIATVSLVERLIDPLEDTPYKITLAVRLPPGESLERIRYVLRPRGMALEPEFALVRPGPWEAIEFTRGEESGTTVLSIPDLGSLGGGTTMLSLLVEPNTNADFELRVDVDGALEAEGLLGRTYELEGELVRTLPGYDRLTETE